MRKQILIFSLIIFSISACKNRSNIKNNFTGSLTLQERRNEQMALLEQNFKAPSGVNMNIYIKYLAYFGPAWSDFRVKSKKALAVLKKYFNGTPYRVIWHWDIDGSGITDYLAVEVEPKIRRGIRRGILVDEQGKIKMYIDTHKGVYAPDYIKGGIYTIVDLKKLGIREGELSCYAIGYIAPDLIGDVETTKGIFLSRLKRKEYNEIYNREKAEIRRRRLVPPNFPYGIFLLQRIDKDLKVMCTAYTDKNAAYVYNDYIQAIYVPHENRAVFRLFTVSFGLNEYYNNIGRKLVEEYRKAKRLGKVFSPPKKINPAHVKFVLESLLY